MDQLGRGEGLQQQQSRRRGTEAPRLHNTQQHPSHEICPRCNSSNTKFCYYNNYSLSQPRYFCKGCRRYWTQGGTLRNVPVGGGCRKSKRLKGCSVASAAAAPGCQPPQQQLQQQQMQQNHKQELQPRQMASQTPRATIYGNINSGSVAQRIDTSSNLAPLLSPFYPGYGGSFLSSLAAIQAMNQPKPPFAQPLGCGSSGGGNFRCPSNMRLQGYSIPSFGIQSFRPSDSSVHQGLVDSAAPAGPPGSDAWFWSSGGSCNDPSHAASASNRNQWTDFPGCGGPDDA
ncbi:hypothetical protein Nepgr_007295 [Nepenthes gracilis]|uniref:Dof zinc finger protein n=1 Tax=Nepenthes gracilis TaxID=150966 RepID=A0AAD3S6P1_NEPGR|nr:hypothetical protein Nepgr_007295 [Nepenthes gracilis]